MGFKVALPLGFSNQIAVVDKRTKLLSLTASVKEVFKFEMSSVRQYEGTDFRRLLNLTRFVCSDEGSILLFNGYRRE